MFDSKGGYKKPRAMPGLEVCWRHEARARYGKVETGFRSVPPGRATPVETVVDTRRDHIDVLMDRVGAECAAGRDSSQDAPRCGGDTLVTHEKVIVLDR